MSAKSRTTLVHFEAGLVEAARQHGLIFHRTTEQQVRHWVRLGKVIGPTLTGEAVYRLLSYPLEWLRAAQPTSGTETQPRPAREKKSSQHGH